MITKAPSGRGLGWRPQLGDHRDYLLEEVGTQPPLPASCDLTNLIPRVFNQGPLGCCTSCGTLEAFEAYHLKKFGKPMAPRSHLFEYHWTRVLDGDYVGDGNDDVGGTIRSAVQATIKYGAPPETDMPFDPANFDGPIPAKANVDAPFAKALKYYLCDSPLGHAQTLYNIKKALAIDGQLVTYGTPVYPQFEKVGSSGVIAAPKGKYIGGHCMAFCGYLANGYLMTLNSWGDKAAAQGGWGAPFDNKALGLHFNGGMGYLPPVYVTKGLVSDAEVFMLESEVN